MIGTNAQAAQERGVYFINAGFRNTYFIPVSRSQDRIVCISPLGLYSRQHQQQNQQKTSVSHLQPAFSGKQNAVSFADSIDSYNNYLVLSRGFRFSMVVVILF